MEFVAKRRYAYMGIPYFHKSFFKRSFDFFRQACEKEGYAADPEQAGWLVPVYVAETDEQARREYESHFWYFTKKLLPGITITPPGYTTPRSVVGIAKAMKTFMVNVETWDQVEEGGYAIVGSVATVRQRMAELIRELGVGTVLSLCQLGTLPADLTRTNMTLMAREVIPWLRRELADLRAPGAARAAAAASA
jgi:alkanesulfonate monooxygenase SsuD/methylene tetrahydromethanopterin reductase-like flavin-dependent oxidoreductase (luciferase family)